MQQYWFTADLHFNHTKVIEYARRPFLGADDKPDVELMNKTLVQRWNEVVEPGHSIYVLGDVGLDDPGKTIELVRQLNGQKYLIFGNHDKKFRKRKEFLDLFVWAKDLAEVTIRPDLNSQATQMIVLCHYAMRIWNKSHYGAWQLYGHSHGNLEDNSHALQLDVGVDCWDYRPVSFEQLREAMSKKTWQPVDHHRPHRSKEGPQG